MLALFHGVFKLFLHQATRKTYNFVPIIPGIHLIIPEYSLILSTTYYSRNYAGIIDACLLHGVIIVVHTFCGLKEITLTIMELHITKMPTMCTQLSFSNKIIITFRAY